MANHKHMTNEERTAQLPEHLRKYAQPPMASSLDQANILLAYYWALWHEIVDLYANRVVPQKDKSTIAVKRT